MSGVPRDRVNRSGVRALLAAAVLLAAVAGAPAQVPPEQAAQALLTGARQAYHAKNYPFAAARFREFLGRFGQHKDAPHARYGLALALLESPDKDYAAAAGELQQLAGIKDFAERPSVLYYLGLSSR